MHASSLDNMRRCLERHPPLEPGTRERTLRVLDLGGADVNGSYRELFPSPRYDFRVADIADSPSVDVKLADPTRIPLEDGSIDVLVSGQMLEHCEFFWLTFAEMVRVLAPDGVLFLIAPSGGPVHRYPVDCYRFLPDSYAALAKHAGCELVECWRDERGPWQDLVGVFCKPERAKRERARMEERARSAKSGAAAIAASPASPATPPPTYDRYARESPEESTRPGVSYRDVLARLHETLRPSLYLEIGVRTGKSLALARGRAIGVDPNPQVSDVRAGIQLHATTSDAFFESAAPAALATPPDLAFIDGMHLFEYALRDLMNVERRSKPTTLAVLDDVFPNHPVQAKRERETRIWSGDVWKLHEALTRRRPDLLLIPIDCAPAGLLLVAGLDRASRVLWEHYNPIVREASLIDEAPPARVLQRAGALAPDDPRLAAAIAALARLASSPGAETSPAAVAAAMRAALQQPGGGAVAHA